jgi:diguanylate cyclase (GGDEF)-like protein
MHNRPGDGQRGFLMRFVHRIGTKIALLVAAAVGVGIVVSGVILADARAALQEQIRHDQAQLTQAYGSAVQQYLDSARHIVESTAADPAIRQPQTPALIFPPLHGVLRLAEPERRAAELGAVGAFPGFEGMMLLTPGGKTYAAEPYDLVQLGLNKDDYSDREWYQGVVHTGRTTWGFPRLSNASGQPIIASATLTLGPNGQTTGILVGVLRLSALGDLARSINPAGNSTLMLFDSEGRPLVYPDPQKIVQFEPVIREVPLLSRALAGEKGPFLYQGAQPELGTILPLQVGDQVWYVIDTMPQAEAFASVNRLVESTVPVLVLGLSLLLGVGLLITRSITVPIDQLGRQLRAMAASDRHPVAGAAEPAAGRVGAPAAELEWLQDLLTDMRQAVVAREQMLRHMADHDPLTGLYNRRRFREELERHLAEWAAADAPGAVLFIDLDNFKYVNDSLGHQAGDEMIARVAGVIRRSFPTGSLARLGGDEFAVVLSLDECADGARLVNRFMESIRRHGVTVGSQTVHVTCSAGLAFYPEAGSTAEELLAHADIAMYQAKHDGRNRAATFAHGGQWQQVMEGRLSWEGRIREALRHDRFTFYAQPIRHLASGRITHYELLLRMIAEDGRVCEPAAFLPTAERFGLIRELDRWVVRHAIGLAGARTAAGDSVRFAANLSGQAVGDEELLGLIQQEAAAAGLAPGMLVLEITETSAIADAEKASAFMQALAQLGISFAIDDFGAGFSSFGSLRSLPACYLKIDGSFIRNLESDPVSQELVRAMVAMARGLSMETVAEFVGGAETIRVLTALGVDYAQGYYIGEPAPLAGR